MRKPISVILALLILTSISCNTKYKLHFYKIDPGKKLELQNEKTYFLKGYVLAKAGSENIITAGRGTMLITDQSMTDPEMEDIPSGLLTTSGKINFRIFAQLPADLKNDSLNLAGNSICQIVGQYNRAESLKIFDCTEGFILIDSVKSNKFFASLSGKYFNIEKDSLVFQGEMKPREKK
ncbi:hypothetical protein TRIP_C90351 [Candidatus Zixiibacteriota bacterium]|nr:hypothetical protein TRIP_C90351 [candidate division Zixibacteria bacterium]